MSISATYYEGVAPHVEDPEAIRAAQHQFTLLPLNVLPTYTPLPNGSRMPLRANPLFVGREPDLRTLARMLKADATTGSKEGKIAAVTGLGGIGKTQLVVEFVHRYGQYFTGGVFWLSFVDARAVSTQVAECGQPGYLQLRPDFNILPIDDQVRLVLGAWQSRLPRLLVFDNCEDEALLAQWSPPTGASHVLVTSHREQWDATLGVQVLPLRVLQLSDSMRLLRKYVPGFQMSDADFVAIANELGNLPLALHLAGSFLEKYHRVLTPAAYLAQLRTTNPLSHQSLTRGGISATGHEQHIGQTFALSYKNLDPTKPTDALALTLLARAVYFAPNEPIPHELLLSTLGLTGNHNTALLQAEDALTRLVELGLIEWASDSENTLRLHRLVVAFLQEVITDSGAQKAVEQALAQNYEHIRTASASSPQRTAAMTQLVARIQSFARRAVYTSQEIQTLFATGTEGNRIATLAIVNTTLDPSCFNIILAAIHHSQSAFEQYQALLTARAMLSKLNEEQKNELASILLSNTGSTMYIRQDTSRQTIRQSILAALRLSNKDQQSNISSSELSMQQDLNLGTEHMAKQRSSFEQGRTQGRTTRSQDTQKAIEQALAQSYEHIRATSTPGPQRTAAMNQLVARIQSFATQAIYTSQEIQTLFAAGTEGNRIVTLAIVNATLDPSCFSIILEAIRHSRSAFEQYQALLVARAILTKINKKQKNELASILLNNTGSAAYISQDASRQTIKQSILAALQLSPEH